MTLPITSTDKFIYNINLSSWKTINSVKYRTTDLRIDDSDFILIKTTRSKQLRVDFKDQICIKYG